MVGSASLAILVLAAQWVLASQALVLVAGGSRVLTFRDMRRVVVVDPQVADVVVASARELLVAARAPGHTKLYVWDAAGRHEYAITVQAVPSVTLQVRRLRDLLPETVTARAVGERAIVLQGTCRSEQERTRALELARQLAGEVTLVNLLTVPGEELSAAERTLQQLRQLYGPGYEYLLWGKATVIVRGPVDERMAEELRALDAALGGEVRVAVVRGTAPGAPPPIEEVTSVLGAGYKVWLLGTNTIVVEGEAPSEQDFERVGKLLEAFAGRAQILNLVTKPAARKLSTARYVELLQAALGQELSVREVGEGAIAVEGTVPDEAAYKRVGELIAAVAADVHVVNLVRIVAPDKRRILIRIKVADVNRERLRMVGVEWGQLTAGGLLTLQESPVIMRVEGGVDNIYDIGATLQALEQRNEAKLLAEPNLVVNDGEQASILVGGQIPIPVAQPGTTGFASITVEWKDYGVNLRVQPRITESGLIEAKVEPEVSSLDRATGVTIGGLTLPGVRTRKASTTVTLPPGATLVIGGLIRADQSLLVRQVPVLSKLPVFGELFKRREFQQSKSELLIFLTPEILPPARGESR
jgi:Flp pilus assembly secretin CpaC